MGRKVDWRAAERRETRYERRELWTTDKTEVVECEEGEDGGREQARCRKQLTEERGRELTW